MNCPYCKKEINGMTGFQELQKFQKHLQSCKKHPDRCLGVDNFGRLNVSQPYVDMKTALEIRHNSGQ